MKKKRFFIILGVITYFIYTFAFSRYFIINPKTGAIASIQNTNIFLLTLLFILLILIIGYLFFPTATKEILKPDISNFSKDFQILLSCLFIQLFLTYGAIYLFFGVQLLDKNQFKAFPFYQSALWIVLGVLLNEILFKGYILNILNTMSKKRFVNILILGIFYMFLVSQLDSKELISLMTLSACYLITKNIYYTFIIQVLNTTFYLNSYIIYTNHLYQGIFLVILLLGFVYSIVYIYKNYPELRRRFYQKNEVELKIENDVLR